MYSITILTVLAFLIYTTFSFTFPNDDIVCGNYTNCTVYLNTTSMEPVQGTSGTFESGCMKIPILGELCIERRVGGDISFQNSDYKISLDGIKFDFDYDFETIAPTPPTPEAQVCINDESIIMLLEKVPALEQYQDIFDSIRQIMHCIPRGLFSVCFTQKGLNCTSPATPRRRRCGPNTLPGERRRTPCARGGRWAFARRPRTTSRPRSAARPLGA